MKTNNIMAKKGINHSNESAIFLVKSNSKTTLSKEQIAFNTLSKKIETLKLQITKYKAEAKYKLDMYHKIIPNLESENLEVHSRFAKFLYKISKLENFNKKQYSEIEQCMVNLINKIVSEQNLDDELKDIYNFYNNANYDKEIEDEVKDVKNTFEKKLKEEMGIEIDLSEFDFTDTSPNNYAKMQAMIAEAMQEKFGENGFKNSKYVHFETISIPKKKTKAELKREELQKQKEELKNKSLRSIYLALAKVLHPDIETDIDKKLEKEELMKQVTVAYENKDLTTLLKLEMQWIYNEKNTELSAEKLKVYIEVMREQANELETQKYTIYQNPRFMPIFDYKRHTKKQFSEEIEVQAASIKAETESISDTIFEPANFNPNKTKLFKTIKYLNNKMLYENSFYDMFSGF